MQVNFFDPAEAEKYIAAAFADDPGRLRHILVIAELARQSARDINEVNPGTNVDEQLVYCAGLVHDIGYAAEARKSGFHPLDGYNFLCAHGAKCLGDLIVGHSSAREEAELLGFALPAGVDDLPGRLVTYWDMQVKQGGEIVGYEERLRYIFERYGEESVVARAHRDAHPRILGIIEQVERLLKTRPE